MLICSEAVVRGRGDQDRSKTPHDDHLDAKKRFVKKYTKTKGKAMMLLPPAALKSPQDGLKFGQYGLKIGPRRLQDLPKTILKTFLLHRLFRLRFWSVLAPTWAPFDPPLGAQDGPKIDAKNVRKSRCRKMASKIAPRRPKMAPRRPRTPQRAPQDPPDPPKCAPRASKIAPRALKFAPRASKSSRDVERLSS